METWKLGIGGLVSKPQTFSLEDLKARPRQEYTATLECSGNGASERFMGAIGNAVWGGTPLALLLEECGSQPEGIEVVFFGVDQGTEKIRGGEYKQNFGRSLSIQDVRKDGVLLAYEMNGKPLPKDHGAPLRLIVPGWYGIAWVKWLDRIELHDRRFLSRFMGRDYVTIRGEQRGDATIWRETSVGKMNLKSIVARVGRRPNGDVHVMGAVWNDGTALKGVQLRIDEGPWQETTLVEGMDSPHCWTFWSYYWKQPGTGEHTLVSRAIDVQGREQPAADDSTIALKKTYWEANQQMPRRIKL
jgi:DMSO/TMAO reductase YedYZ molybdopterin-dependent catalytic subunit